MTPVLPTEGVRPLVSGIVHPIKWPVPLFPKDGSERIGQVVSLVAASVPLSPPPFISECDPLYLQVEEMPVKVDILLRGLLPCGLLCWLLLLSVMC